MGNGGAATLVEAAIPDDIALPETWQACAVLLPHTRAALDLTSNGMARIAQYLGDSGNYLAARDLWQVIADAFTEDDAYGPEHRKTLVARQELTDLTGWAGEAAATVRDLFLALLPVEERALGPEDPDTLAARHELA